MQVTCMTIHQHILENKHKLSLHVALIENIITSHDDTTVVLHWNPVLEHVISHFDIECFYTKQNTKHSAQSTVFRDNFTAQLSGLTPSTFYKCCVSAILQRYSSTTCTQFNTSASSSIVYSEVSTIETQSMK